MWLCVRNSWKFETRSWNDIEKQNKERKIRKDKNSSLFPETIDVQFKLYGCIKITSLVPSCQIISARDLAGSLKIARRS